MKEQSEDIMLSEILMLKKENEELRQNIAALQHENRDLAAFISQNTTFPSTSDVEWNLESN